MSNDAGRESRKDPASVFQAPEPEVCRPQPEGRLDTLWPIDLGEFVVGSEHEVTVRAPRNLHEQGATGLLIVDAGLGVATTITGSWDDARYEHGKQAGPFRFKYKPEKPGLDRATVHVTVRWADGHVETRAAQVTARARAIDAAPGGTSGGNSAAKPAPQPPPKRAKDIPATEDGATARDNVRDAHGYLMDQQREGIQIVEREAARFKPKPAPKSIWQQLADLAITVGTSGIASIVSKLVGDRVAEFIFAAKRAEAAAKTVDDAIQFKDRKARDAAEGPIVPTPTQTPEAATAKQQRALEDFTSGRVQDAVTGIFESAAAAVTNHDESTDEATAESPKASSKGKETETPKAPSKDKEIAFFSAQRTMQGKAATLSKMQLNSLIGEILKTSPEHGPGIVEAMLDGIMKAADSATDKQANATSAQFATYVARTKLGTQTVDTPSGEKTVTNLDGQRKFENPVLAPGLAAGVLEIEVSRDQNSGAVDVTRARINNVSWLVADRLLDLDLRTAGVPVRISVNHGATLITLDESGRVRVGGGPLELRGPNLGSEAQSIREAERIVRLALQKPLRQQNPDIQLVTNDDSQPRAAKKDVD